MTLYPLRAQLLIRLRSAVTDRCRVPVGGLLLVVLRLVALGVLDLRVELRVRVAGLRQLLFIDRLVALFVSHFSRASSSWAMDTYVCPVPISRPISHVRLLETYASKLPWLTSAASG